MANLVGAVLTAASFAVVAPDTALPELPDDRTDHGILKAFGSPPGHPAMPGDPLLQPAVQGFFFSMPATRAPSPVFSGLRSFSASADSAGFIPEISRMVLVR